VLKDRKQAETDLRSNSTTFQRRAPSKTRADFHQTSANTVRFRDDPAGHAARKHVLLQWRMQRRAAYHRTVKTMSTNEPAAPRDDTKAG
jgi:hypothetical protein